MNELQEARSILRELGVVGEGILKKLHRTKEALVKIVSYTRDHGELGLYSTRALEDVSEVERFMQKLPKKLLKAEVRVGNRLCIEAKLKELILR